MTISVIIPTYNAAGYIRPLIRSLLSQNRKITEILVIDSESTDATRSLARKFPVRIVTVPKSSFDHGGTRTRAARMARGDIVVFLTQDALPANRSSIERLVRPFRDDPDIGAVCGRQIPRPDATPFAAHSRSFIYPSRSFIRVLSDRDRYRVKTVFLSNAFTAYRKSALKKIGYFKSNLISTEDTYAGAKMLLAGMKLAYAADAVVRHSHNYTVWQEFKRYFDIGVFHKRENWIIRNFGKADSEGLQYVRSEFSYLIRRKLFTALPEFLIRNFLKLLGYRLGYHFHGLPRPLVLKFSMHRSWWEKNS